MPEERNDPGQVRDVALRLLDCLSRAVGELDRQTLVRKEKLEGGATQEYTEVSPPGLIDRDGLKKLTGVLKDLRDVLTDGEQKETTTLRVLLEEVEDLAE